jgi:hypothetical protein
MLRLIFRYAVPQQNEITIKQRNKKSFLLQIIFLFLIFQQALIFNIPNPQISSLITNLDDFIVLILLIILLFKSVKGFKILKAERTLLLCFGIMLFIGLLASFIFHIQPILFALQDMFLCSRFIIAYFAIRAIFSNGISKTFVYDNFNTLSCVIAILFFVLTVHDYIFTPFFKLTDFRYFALSTRLFFPDPTYLAASCILMICILAASLEEHKSNWVFIIMLSFTTCMTFRTKAIGFIAVFLMLYFIIIKLNIKSKLFFFLVASGTGLYLGYNQIIVYFFTNELSPRKLMFLDSFKLANKYFPLGAGFGTFGSHISAVNYSPLYYMLGYGFLNGMSQGTAAYLNDGFWPIIIGQFGYIALAFFLIVIVSFFVIIFKVQKLNKCVFVALLSLMLYLMISSTAETAFFNPFATVYFILFGILISQILNPV